MLPTKRGKRFTNIQRTMLESAYNSDERWTQEDINGLVEATGLTAEQITQWWYRRPNNTTSHRESVELRKALCNAYHSQGRNDIPVDERETLAKQLNIPKDKISYWVWYHRQYCGCRVEGAVKGTKRKRGFSAEDAKKNM